MDLLINNNLFLKKIFKRKLRRSIAYHCCIMDYLSRAQKVEYTIKRLSEIPISHARIIIHYWEDEKKMIRILKRHKVTEYSIVREYKKGTTPGFLNINVVERTINIDFFKELLNRHYGCDFSTQNAIDIVPYVVIDTGRDELIAFHFYDDRGYYEYHIPKSIRNHREYREYRGRFY